MAMEKILIVDDDLNICELLRLNLEHEGYRTLISNDGEEAINKFNAMDPNVVLLDVMLPGKKNGLQVCAEIRKENAQVPIIMISAKSESFDEVLGLNLGADDYITKPFDPRVVLARIRAVLRRKGESPEDTAAKIVQYDRLSIDKDRFELRIDGKIVDAPPKELQLLYCLAANPNHVYTRDQLLDEVWGFEYYGDSRTIDVHIKRLREKLDGVSDQWELRTVWGVGYKFALNDGGDNS
ncbi:MAG: response regulator transcription factor [Oscillospiraceae bacterium]|nr:response regulator transcription factor [Oscillospiraceae bacterium]